MPMSVPNILTANFFKLILECGKQPNPAALPKDLIARINRKTDTYIGTTPIYVQHLAVLSYRFYQEHLVEYDRHNRLLYEVFESEMSGYSEILEKIEIVENAVLHSEERLKRLTVTEIITYNEAYITLHTICNSGKVDVLGDCLRAFLNCIDAMIKSDYIDSLVEISINDTFPDARLHVELKFGSNWKMYGKKSAIKIAQESGHFANEYWYRIVEPMSE